MFPKSFEEMVNDISRLEVCHLMLFYSELIESYILVPVLS